MVVLQQPLYSKLKTCMFVCLKKSQYLQVNHYNLELKNAWYLSLWSEQSWESKVVLFPRHHLSSPHWNIYYFITRWIHYGVMIGLTSWRGDSDKIHMGYILHWFADSTLTINGDFIMQLIFCTFLYCIAYMYTFLMSCERQFRSVYGSQLTFLYLWGVGTFSWPYLLCITYNNSRHSLMISL